MLSELITNWTIYANKVNNVLWFWHSFLINFDFAVSYICGPIILQFLSFYAQFAALLTLLFIIIINLAVGILPHVDNFAHIGGFLSGFLLGFVFLIRPQFGWVNQRNSPGYIAITVKSKHKTYQYVLWVLSLILLIAGYVLGILSLFFEFASYFILCTFLVFWSMCMIWDLLQVNRLPCKKFTVCLAKFWKTLVNFKHWKTPIKLQLFKWVFRCGPHY